MQYRSYPYRVSIIVYWRWTSGKTRVSGQSHFVGHINIKREDRIIPSRFIELFFALATHPSNILFYKVIFNVYLSIRSLIQCQNSLRFGHTQKFCHSKQRCIHCSTFDHNASSCESRLTSALICVHSKANYLLTDRSCPK